MYDYAKYKFFKAQYEEAGIYFKKCKKLNMNLTPSLFHKIKLEELNGFCAACSSEITEKSSLLMQFLYSTQTNHNVSKLYYFHYLLIYVFYIIDDDYLILFLNREFSKF